jgi:hypothetical protein
MDLALTFEDVVRIVRQAPDPASGWASLVSYLGSRGGESLRGLTSVDLREDVRDLRIQLEALVRR